eukprot:SAG11_NODE_1016_length_6169_cov_19.544975_4_plen_317_part_00
MVHRLWTGPGRLATSPLQWTSGLGSVRHQWSSSSGRKRFFFFFLMFNETLAPANAPVIAPSLLITAAALRPLLITAAALRPLPCGPCSSQPLPCGPCPAALAHHSRCPAALAHHSRCPAALAHHSRCPAALALRPLPCGPCSSQPLPAALALRRLAHHSRCPAALALRPLPCGPCSSQPLPCGPCPAALALRRLALRRLALRRAEVLLIDRLPLELHPAVGTVEIRHAGEVCGVRRGGGQQGDGQQHRSCAPRHRLLPTKRSMSRAPRHPLAQAKVARRCSGPWPSRAGVDPAPRSVRRGLLSHPTAQPLRRFRCC